MAFFRHYYLKSRCHCYHKAATKAACKSLSLVVFGSHVKAQQSEQPRYCRSILPCIAHANQCLDQLHVACNAAQLQRFADTLIFICRRQQQHPDNTTSRFLIVMNSIYLYTRDTIYAITPLVCSDPGQSGGVHRGERCENSQRRSPVDHSDITTNVQS